ncbi:MAG: hypothetical protein U0791_23750 [Gemmataceae bacterium]
MLLTVRDDATRYRIEAPDHCQFRLDDGGTDFLIVPDPEQPEVPYWLFDHILIAAARDGEFGLRLLSEEPVSNEARTVGRGDDPRTRPSIITPP